MFATCMVFMLVVIIIIIILPFPCFHRSGIRQKKNQKTGMERPSITLAYNVSPLSDGAFHLLRRRTILVRSSGSKLDRKRRNTPPSKEKKKMTYDYLVSVRVDVVSQYVDHPLVAPPSSLLQRRLGEGLERLGTRANHASAP